MSQWTLTYEDDQIEDESKVPQKALQAEEQATTSQLTCKECAQTFSDKRRLAVHMYRKYGTKPGIRSCIGAVRASN